MRYKVKAVDKPGLARLLGILAKKDIEPLVQDTKRFCVSVEIGASVRQELAKLGFTAVLDPQMEPE